MNRLFGASSSKPKPNLADAIASTDVRIDSIEVKIRKLDAELTKFRDQMKRMKDGPGKVRCTVRTLRRLARREILKAESTRTDLRSSASRLCSKGRCES